MAWKFKPVSLEDFVGTGARLVQVESRPQLRVHPGVRRAVDRTLRFVVEPVSGISESVRDGATEAVRSRLRQDPVQRRSHIRVLELAALKMKNATHYSCYNTIKGKHFTAHQDLKSIPGKNSSRGIQTSSNITHHRNDSYQLSI